MTTQSLFLPQPVFRVNASHLEPGLVIVTDPGTRNLGSVIFKTKDGIKINKDTIINIYNYEIIHVDLLDVKSKITGISPTTNQPIYDRNTKATLADIESNLNLLLVEGKENSFASAIRNAKQQHEKTHNTYFYSENQEGIGPEDRKDNPFLADQLMVQCFVNGCLAGIMRNVYGIKKIKFPGKTVKWGNSSVPKTEISSHMTDNEKKIARAKNKKLRKDFFVHFVMYYLQKSKQIEILTKLESMDFEDRAHICDAFCSGVRALMMDYWLGIEDKTKEGNNKKYSNIPSPVLSDVELNHVLKMLKLNPRTNGITFSTSETTSTELSKQNKQIIGQKRKRTKPKKEVIVTNGDVEIEIIHTQKKLKKN